MAQACLLCSFAAGELGMDEDLEEVLRRKDDGALSWICAVCSELGELVYCDLCKKGFHIDEEWYVSHMHAFLIAGV